MATKRAYGRAQLGRTALGDDSPLTFVASLTCHPTLQQTPNLASALNNLGVRLSALGRRDDALAPTEEAVTTYRTLAEANPAAYGTAQVLVDSVG